MIPGAGDSVCRGAPRSRVPRRLGTRFRAGQHRITPALCVRSPFGHGIALKISRFPAVASKPRFTRWPCAPANASTESVLPPPLKISVPAPIPKEKSVARDSPTARGPAAARSAPTPPGIDRRKEMPEAGILRLRSEKTCARLSYNATKATGPCLGMWGNRERRISLSCLGNLRLGWKVAGNSSAPGWLRKRS